MVNMCGLFEKNSGVWSSRKAKTESETCLQTYSNNFVEATMSQSDLRSTTTDRSLFCVNESDTFPKKFFIKI